MNIVDAEVTDRELAALVGLTDRRIRQLATEGKLVRVARNKFRLADAMRVLLDEAAENNEGSELQKERLRKLRAEASLAELTLARERGLVALLSEFERVQASRWATVRANVMQVPTRAVLQLLGCTDESEFKAKLKAELILALKTAANATLELPDEPDDEPDDEQQPGSQDAGR